MKINYLTDASAKKSYRCTLFGHDFIETKKVNSHFSEYQCSVCKMLATNDSKGHKITLTSKLKEINETLFYLNLKKQFVAKFYFKKDQ